MLGFPTFDIHVTGCRNFKRTVLVFSACLLLSSVSLFAQGSSGRIQGTVTDQSGAAMPGVTITIADVERGNARTVTTDAAGEYNAPSLLPGAYRIRAEFAGFSTAERTNITLEVGSDIRIDLALQPGEQKQVVTVQAEAPLIETNNAELGGTIPNKVINDLPLNGRNFENLLDLRPGVSKYPGNSGWSNSPNGGRPHDNFYMVEGIDSNDPWMAQSVMNAVMAAGDAGTMLPIDAIDEFKTQQNPGAEYGFKPGAIVNVGIKSGTNGFHGTAYAYGRTDSWDARDYFNPGPQPPLEVEQYGASFGGRIIPDKLFFFANFEAQHYSVGNPTQHDVPITSPNSTDPNSLVGACNAALAAGTLRPLSAQLAGLSSTCTPLSNFPGLFPVNNGATTTIVTSLASQNDIYAGLIKMDYHLNTKNSFSGMYFISPGNGTFVDNATFQINPQWLTVQYARSQVGSGSWTWVPSSSVVNSLRVGYSHYYQVFSTPDASQNPANYSFNGNTYHLYTGQTNPAYFGLPAILFQGGLSFELGNSWPKRVGPDGVYQVTDSVSYLKGKHAIKFGGDILVNQSTNNVTANTKGPFRFRGGLPAFFTGNISRAQISSGNFLRHLQNEGYGIFVQDDWRITPRVTINMGLRYELTSVFHESDHLIGNFIPSLGGLIQEGKQLGSVINGDHNNFAPRIGVAWDMFGTGRTVLRAGAGIYYESYSYDSFMAVGNLLGLRTVPTGVNLYTNGNPTPFTAGGTINLGAIVLGGGALGSASTPGSVRYNYANNGPNTPLYSATPGCGDGTVTLPSGFTPTPCNIFGVDRNLRTPYVSKWSLDMQHGITKDLSLDVAYVGNHATKLLGVTDLNQPQFVNGFSPGWGNPAVAGTPANLCLASASQGYNNCNPDSGLEQAAAPFNSKFPYLGIINYLSNNNFANYHGLQVSLTQRTWHGLSYVLGYTYSHALSQSPDNWSFLQPINSNNTRQLYGSSTFDIRHHFTFSTTYALPSRKSPLQLLEGWSINSIINLQSAAPWGVNDVSTDFSGTGEINSIPINGETWDFFGNAGDFKTTKNFASTNGGAQGIPYFAGTSNPTCLARATAMGPLAVASLTNLGCYAVGNSVLVPPAFGSYGTAGPNIFRGFPFYNVDFSITKTFKIKERYTAQFRAEFFNIFNHPNISNVFGGPGGDNTYTDPTADAGASFGFRPQTPDVTSSNPVLGSGGPRAIQLGLKIIF